MIGWLGRLLYESTAVEFRTGYSIEESVERLRAVTKRSAFSATGAAAVGRVSAQRVRLQRVIPMVQNSFKPFFLGRFESRDGVTVLKGVFGMSLFTKIFMTFWLGVVALFGVSFWVGSLSAARSYPRPLVFGPFLMLIAGLGLVAFGKWLARNDVAWLTGVIGRALDVPGVGATLTSENETDPAAVPLVLKAAALFLAGSGLLAIFVGFVEPRAFPNQAVRLPTIFLRHGYWHVVYAVLALVLAAGVWRRRPWAWWGGFLALGSSILSSLFFLRGNAPMVPPFIGVVFAILSCVVVGVWGRWWYAQRRHFLWA